MSGAFRIAASILSADFAHLGDAVAAAERGGADWIHVDVMDGRFVPEITIGAVIVEAVRSVTRLPVDVHLMIVEPERFVGDFVAAGADMVTVHAEASVHLQRVLIQIREAGAKAGVALNPSTPPNVLDYVLDDVDLVLVMSVNPGFGGQRFIPNAYTKLRRIKDMLGTRPVEVSVDGGVKLEHVRPLAEAGATVLVAGSAVFGAPDPAAIVREMKRLAELGPTKP